ncbi:hypothetical protein GFL38_14070 [Rhizobium leguminosarum bv. viciae]|nr:hypothetical protein [Rhizobium leguminosarum bv. viciae]NKQ70966.1 hypothetical protein [Rhizobium ruizarguesonis]NKQ78667.1 hypothetical protein [Rhizobium ruizarguesonis]
MRGDKLCDYRRNAVAVAVHDRRCPCRRCDKGDLGPLHLPGQIDQLKISATNDACRLGTEQAELRQDGELRDLKASLRYD